MTGPSLLQPTSNIALLQPLYLDAGGSLDEDNIGIIPFEFSWSCEDKAGDVCVSLEGEALDLELLADEAFLSIPAATLPIGELAPLSLFLT